MVSMAITNSPEQEIIIKSKELMFANHQKIGGH